MFYDMNRCDVDWKTSLVKMVERVNNPNAYIMTRVKSYALLRAVEVIEKCGFISLTEAYSTYSHYYKDEEASLMSLYPKAGFKEPVLHYRSSVTREMFFFTALSFDSCVQCKS